MFKLIFYLRDFKQMCLEDSWGFHAAAVAMDGPIARVQLFANSFEEFGLWNMSC